MFTNSLFCDYLLENGMRTWKDESTRDIICLEFNYGSRSYGDEIAHLQKVLRSSKKELDDAYSSRDNYLIKICRDKVNKIKSLYTQANINMNKYELHTKDEIRSMFYRDGVSVTYVTRKKSDGSIKDTETIHYKMLFRSTGKAKKGSCMFIRDELYEKALHFLRMGIELPDENAMIVEISAYSPLVASGIVDRVRIIPENILILKDVDRYFTTNVVSVETDEDRHCIARRLNDYQLKNTLFDGQALIDSGKFPSWGNGYILLRHHFCKMAAFCTNIQDFFRDYFGDQYETATVTDMFGVSHRAKDIELITTDNAMKYLKFGVSYGYWCEWVHKNDCMFGIVKTAHESKLGQYQKMSYQMVNSLNEEIMPAVAKTSVDYVNLLKRSDTEFLNYLLKNRNFSNDYEVLIALCNHNPEFTRSEYFRERKSRIISAYVQKIKSGELMQNAENLTVVGSPYAMLLYAASGNPDDVDKDITFRQEPDAVQCYTERFSDGEYLAFFRSPFNGRYNLAYLHNTYHGIYKRYFRFGRQIIAINMNGTDAQDRSNGMDQDLTKVGVGFTEM